MASAESPRSQSGDWTLRIQAAVDGDLTILTTSGRLGAASSGQLLDALGATTGRGHVLLDLTSVDYVSSAGLKMLDEVEIRLRSRGSELLLCGISEPVRFVFDLAGLLGRFTIESSLESALAHVRRKSLT